MVPGEFSREGTPGSGPRLGLCQIAITKKETMSACESTELVDNCDGVYQAQPAQVE